MRSFLLLLAGLNLGSRAVAASAPGPFFEPEQPFFQSQVEVEPVPRGLANGGDLVVRGILLPLSSGHCVLFDQELLRMAGIWAVPAGQPPVTLMNMAQISYANPRRKAAADHPRPTGRILIGAAAHPGVAEKSDALFNDPRPAPSPGDAGRGAMPAEFARFDGVELAGATAVLRYHSGATAVAEWYEARAVGEGMLILRHFEVGAHAAPLRFAVGGVSGATWALANALTATGTTAESGVVHLTSNEPALSLSEERSEIVATLAASAGVQRVSLGMFFASAVPAALVPSAPTPPLPVKTSGLRWPGSATSTVQLASIQQNGLMFDRLAMPEENPWKRRVRPADIAFLTEDRAAVVGYDGDVWLVDGLGDPALAQVSWRRYASGLQEPLAIVAPGGVIQVATKNGVVRLHDRDGNGEADWFENFNDQMVQSQTTRSFPLDMAVGPDGSTYVSQGGIVTRSGLVSGGEGTPQTGGILKISKDGRSSTLFASGAREPFLTVHPETGVVTATDQQGNFIPSSVCYLVRPGDDFGFLQDQPAKLAPPLTWIPHEEDSSSTSEVWMMGKGLGPWAGRLLHLSYGTGRIFLITPDLDAPTPQGSVIPLGLKTDLPLLHARVSLKGDAVFLTSFQIWGTTTGTIQAIGRLRPGTTPITTALAARSSSEGVVLEFATPLDPASVKPEAVHVRGWNYQRSKAYGSGRYTLDGPAGTTPFGIAQTVLSEDRKSVFVHLPHLPAMMQLEVRHDFILAAGAPARGTAYFTIHQPHAVDLAGEGFAHVDLGKKALMAAREVEAPPTVALGKGFSETMGCIACHSSDGSTEGKVGSTWKGLFGKRQTFIDGTTEIADEFYLREKILDPQQKRLKAGQIEMPSYRGVLSDQQLDSLILYIKSLRGGNAAPRNSDN